MSVSHKKELATRLAKIRSQMDQAGLDTLLVYSCGQHTIMKPNYYIYLTGFKNLGPHSFLVIPREADPVLLITPPWDAERATEESLVQNVVASRNPVEDCARLVNDVRGKGGLGLVGKFMMPYGFHQQLRATVGDELRPADDILEAVARVKSEGELAYLRKAAAIGDAGVQAFVEAVKEGMTEYEVAAEINYAMRILGCEDNFGLVASAERNDSIHSATDRKLRRGDVVIAEITPGWKGYYTQFCRTVVVGEPSALQQEKFDLLSRSYQSSIEACRPGATPALVTRALNAVLEQAGYGEYCCPPFMRVRGHGFGCGSLAPGEFDEDNHQIIEPGMTFVIHPNQYIPETGYLMLGDMFVVTENGAECLSKTEPKLLYSD